MSPLPATPKTANYPAGWLAGSVRRLRSSLAAARLAKQLLSSPVFDAEFYAAQVGLTAASPLAAAQHFLAHRAAGHWSPHPLVWLPYLPKKQVERWQRGGTPAMLEWFSAAASCQVAWSAFLDPRTLPPAKLAKNGLSLLQNLGASDLLPLHRGLDPLSLTWGASRKRILASASQLHDALGLPTPQIQGPLDRGEGLIDWDAARRALPERVAGRVSVVIPVWQDCRLTIDAVRSLFLHTPDHDLEVLVIDNGSDQPMSLALDAAATAYPNTKVIRLDRNYNFALGSNFGAAISTGEYVLFLNNDTEVRANWLEPLLARIADPSVLGVQPLLLYPDDTIQSAGTRYLAADYLPCSPLAGHPAEDGSAVAGLPFQAVTAAALLMRATDVVELNGFDASYVNGSEDLDLCLRAAKLRPGSFAVEPASIVEHRESQTPGRSARISENRRLFMERWRGQLPASDCPELDRLGMRIAHLRSDQALLPAALPVVVRDVASAEPGAHRLRWSIKNPAPGSWWGRRWGDTRFIDALAFGLRNLGQDVVSYRYPTHAAPATGLDDVNLVIRGLHRTAPHPGQTNVLWIISHPEEVTPEELHGFDLVYAASQPWAEWASQTWGVEVRTLLQAADIRHFTPPTSADTAGNGVVFVGQTRPDGPRQIVMDAVAAGLEPQVWGEGWEAYLPTANIRGTSYPVERLAELYHSASIVLSDHHRDMAREGFIANRVFDAVAAGARVISDPVAGLDSLFGGAVRTYTSIDDLARLTSLEGAVASFPDPQLMSAIAQRIAGEHSFECRAQRLVADVMALR